MPAGAETAFAELASAASAMVTAAWPIVTVVMVGLAGIGLFKKFISRVA